MVQAMPEAPKRLRLSDSERRQLYRVLTPIAGLYVVGALFMGFFPQQVCYLALIPTEMDLTRLYTLATYAVLHDGVSHVVQVLVFILFPCLILVGRLSDKAILLVTVGGLISTGLLLTATASRPTAFVGGIAAAWALAGVVGGMFLSDRRSFRLLSGFYAVLMATFMILGLFGVSEFDRANSATGLLFLSGTTFYLRRMRERGKAFLAAGTTDSVP